MSHEKDGYKYIALLIVVMLLSLFVKMNAQVSGLTGLSYSDIKYGVFSTRFVWIEEDKWFNRNAIEALRSGTRICPLVYKDYLFEYPPVIGLLWQFTTCVSIHLSFPEKYSSKEYQLYAQKASQINLLINAFILSTAYILLIFVLRKKMNIYYKKLLLLILSPSVFMYLFYNWDVLCIFFYVLSIYFYSTKRYFESGLYLGLSVSTKLFTIIPALVYLIDAARSRKALIRFILGLMMGLLPFVFLIVYSPIGFKVFLQYHASWYCENCIYLLFINDIFSGIHKYLSIIAESLVVILAFTMYIRQKDLHVVSFYSLLGAISLSYVFSPQMLLILIPLALMNLRSRDYTLFFISDFLNALIVPIFFVELSLKYSPWNLGSLTQTLAQLRNIVLLYIYIKSLMHLRSS
jgi:hypothetical protein